MLQKICNLIESIAGLLAAFVIGFAPPILLALSGLMNFGLREPGLAFLCIVGALATGAMAGYVATLASRVVERDGSLWPANPVVADEEVFRIEETPSLPATQPLAIGMAYEMRPAPLPVRVVLSLWWLTHFGAAVVAGHFAAQLVAGNLRGPGGATLFLVGVSLHFAFLFAANLYLLLSAAVALPWEELWHDLWRYRIMIDLLVAIGSMVVAPLMK